MSWLRKKQISADTDTIEFLPDADVIERQPLPRTARTTLYVVFVMLTTFLVWAIVSDVDLVVVARGRLVTPLPNITVQPLDTSIVQRIDVRVGQVVKRGQRLATLDPTFTGADETQLRKQLLSYENQLKQLEADLGGGGQVSVGASDSDAKIQVRLSGERRANYDAQVRQLEEKVAQTHAALETNRQDQKSLASRVKVLKEMASMQEQLVSQKFAARTHFLDAQDKLLDTERTMKLAVNQEQELRRELSALEAEKASFKTGWRQKLMEDVLTVSREMDSVREQLQKANKRHNLVVLTAPSDAVVLDIEKYSVGSVIEETKPFFTLVPIGTDLEAEVQIDSLDVGYVKLGDVAHLKLDAYPFQKHGTLPARLRTISEDAFRRDSASGTGADAYYVSRIRLEGTHLKLMPKQARLLPGMTLTAEVVVGKRSVISYIMWPLVKALGESIREP